MKSHLARLEEIQNTDSIFEFVWNLIQRINAKGLSYHQSPIFDSPTSRATVIFARGYALEHQKAYVAEGFRQRDPFPALTFDNGPVLTWQQIMVLGARVPGAGEYFDEMRKRGILHGISMALYGPQNREAYATIEFDSAPDDLSGDTLQMVYGLLQAAHVRICHILCAEAAPMMLSDRELEVIRWIARGKSSTDIAAILGLSPETVRTYTRRVFEKLGVNDRVAATVRALKLGLVEG